MKKKFKDLTIAELFRFCKKHGYQYIKCNDCQFYHFCYEKKNGYTLREFIAPVDWEDLAIWHKEIEVGK